MIIQAIDIRSQQKPEVDLEELSCVLSEVIRQMDLQEGEIEISLADPETIQTLNTRYRGIAKPTNVLAFPQYEWDTPGIPVMPFPPSNASHPPVVLGDVIVSVETVNEDAIRNGRSLKTELYRICIHGILHLFGYDHTDDTEADLMEVAESKAWSLLEQLINLAE
jgi:probable rRNA maturation factor